MVNTLKKTVIKKYAELIVKKGANVQKGQHVIIRAGLDQPEFVYTVAEFAYKCGASSVTVDWSYQPISRLKYKKEEISVLSHVEKWEIEKMEHLSETLPVMIYLESSDPDGLNGIDQNKYAKSAQARMKVLKPIRDKMDDKYQWVIAAVPGRKWAMKVFPNERPSVAVERLWEVIIKASRADGENPIAAWDKHNAQLLSRCDYLNSLDLDYLEISSSNGTKIKIGLISDALFMGGAERVLETNVVFNPNIPSEEVFITPKKGSAEGVVYSTKPFSYRGQLISSFCVEFKDGKAVSIKGETEKETEILTKMISMDDGSAYLGEVALVPYTSPIRETEILFYNTLFDENAACHLAFGKGFASCLKNFDKYSQKETVEKGINDSVIHEDFMIGAKDTDIIGIKCNGEIVQIFKNGEWAF